VGAVKVVLTDFERTLVRMFEDSGVEEKFFQEVRNLCDWWHIPNSVIEVAGKSPYALWMEAHRWVATHRLIEKPRKKAHSEDGQNDSTEKSYAWKKAPRWKNHDNPLHAEKFYYALTRIAIKYEKDAAESAELFEDVQPALEKLKAEGIPVMVVTNNGTAEVDRILERNDVRPLVDDVLGRDFNKKMIGKLKPRPNLLVEALKRSGHDASTALLIGDSLGDMKAGRAANIRYRVGVLEHSTASEQQLRDAGANLVLNRFGDLQSDEEVQHLLHGGDSPAGR
jgi:phosphoglycolate phosphatase-like HAD superfamily hydrolase